MKDKVESLLKNALKNLNYPTENIIIQNSKNPKHGDFSTNIAMTLSGKLNEPPQNIADSIIKTLFQLKDRGCLFQLNMFSLTNFYGRKVTNITKKLL